jgi:hypothetical protein
MRDPDILRLLAPIIQLFEQAAVSYYIGGSLASSLYGTARTTLDVDIVAGLKPEHVSLLKDELQSAYYIDEEMIGEAIEHGSSFNLIHLETSLKIDVFILTDKLFPRSAMKRRRQDVLSEEQGAAFFCSAEDIILHKLQWYEKGGRVSERQWLDVLGVVKVQRDSLDGMYLKHWSKELGLSDLLEMAFREADVRL